MPLAAQRLACSASALLQMLGMFLRLQQPTSALHVWLQATVQIDATLEGAAAAALDATPPERSFVTAVRVFTCAHPMASRTVPRYFAVAVADLGCETSQIAQSVVRLQRKYMVAQDGLGV